MNLSGVGETQLCPHAISLEQIPPRGGDTLGDRSSLVVAVWEHNLPKIPDLKKPTLTLGE